MSKNLHEEIYYRGYWIKVIVRPSVPTNDMFRARAMYTVDPENAAQRCWREASKELAYDLYSYADVESIALQNAQLYIDNLQSHSSHH